MSVTSVLPSVSSPVGSPSVMDEIVALGSEFNRHQYRLVCLAAKYEEGLEWFAHGFPSAAISIAGKLGIHTATVHEWIRVGHALEALPLIDRAFYDGDLSYAKARILTRWADEGNEHDLLDLAVDRSANRLTAAVAKYLAGEESDEQRDERHHLNRRCTTYTDADGMVVLRAVLPPGIGKQITESIDTVVREVASTPAVDESESSADDSEPSMNEQLAEMKQRWQPADGDDFGMPSMAQQRADALVLLFLGKNIAMTTEVVVHVRGDGTTFDDGTPITNNVVCQRLDQSFIRAMVHDNDGNPIDASNRRRHPTTRQKRVVMETHNHECVECQSTDILELDHNPPYEQTRHTITTELEPRCAPCHRARHRYARSGATR